MLREIKTHEKITDKFVEKKEEGYKKIKPETNMSLDEAKKFVEDLFR